MYAIPFFTSLETRPVGLANKSGSGQLRTADSAALGTGQVPFFAFLCLSLLFCSFLQLRVNGPLPLRRRFLSSVQALANSDVCCLERHGQAFASLQRAAFA